MPAGDVTGSIARVALDSATSGTQAAGVVPLNAVVGDLRLGIFYNGASPAFSLLVDGDPTPVVLSAGPAAGQVWRDVELAFIFAGGTSMPADGICGSAASFAQGIGIEVKGTSIGMLAPRSNADFAGTCDRVEKFTHTDPWGVVYVYKIAAVLDGDAGDTVDLTISEDATTLTTLSQATPILRYRTLG